MEKESTVKFTIIDEIMGEGKTSRAFDEINGNPDKKYLFVTLLLDELERFEKACANVEILFPKEKDETASKFENFKKLIPYGQNIGITHVMFQMIDEETIGLLKQQNYILIIDETIDCIKVIQDISPFEIKVLFESGALLFDQETNQVSWNNDEYPNIKGWCFLKEVELKKIKKWCDDGALSFEPDQDTTFKDYKGKFIWMLPPNIFSCFNEVRVLTYQFKDTFMELYLKINNFDYEIQAMSAVDENLKKEQIKKLITVVEGNYNKRLEGLNLTHSFYKALNAEDAKIIGMTCENCIRNIKGKGNYQQDIKHYVMWTCPKSAINKIVGVGPTGQALRGRRKPRHFNQHDHKSTEKNPTYMYSNARATNVYKHKTIALYLISRFMNPNLKNYFSKKIYNVTDGIEDRFALNELIQWVWRSAIREGKPITVFIASSRMRRLFMNWLDSRRKEMKETMGYWDSDIENEVVYLDNSEFYEDERVLVKYVDKDGSIKLEYSGYHEMRAKFKISRATKKEVELYEAGEPLSMTEHVSLQEPVRYAQWGYSKAEGIPIAEYPGNVCRA